jgi:hypothetical protein
MCGIVSAGPPEQYFRMTPQSTDRRGSVPGRKWYAVAVLVLIAGTVLFAVFLSARLSKLGDDIVRVTVPGQAELTLEPGSYTIFHERGGMTDGAGGDVITADDVTGLRITVQKPGTGTTAPLAAHGGSRYIFDGHSGQSLFTFMITEPGTYRLVATYDDGRPGSPAVLAIARGFVGNLLTTIFVSLAIMFGSIAIAGPIGIYVYGRRRSALGQPIQYFSIWRVLAFELDFVTGGLVGVFITELLTGLLAKGGFSLPVWPSLLWLAVIVGYFVFSRGLFGATLWEHILKTRSRAGKEA